MIRHGFQRQIRLFSARSRQALSQLYEKPSLSRLQDFVTSKTLSHVRQGREISMVLQEIMKASESADETLKALNQLDEWNLDRHEGHIQAVLRVLLENEEYEKAADIYWNFIDPGYQPVTDSFLGLYAIAMAAESSSPTELVLDAVRCLNMTSPGYLEQYLLTAGQALGQAGHWEGLHRKAKDGHLWDLTAPAMKACVLCGRLDEALELYKPEGSLACRDLAIQAWDPADPEIWELEYEDPSDEAKLALLVACSYQHSWRDAVDRFANYQYDRQFLLATMRACHTQKQFAAAYTCLARCLMNLDDEGGLPTNEFSLNHLLPFCLEQSEETDEFFATIMVTLSGLSLPLHELIEEEELIQSDWEQSKAVWAAYRMSPQNDPRGRPWMLNLHRLLQQQVIDEKFLLILTATVKSGNSMSQPDCGLWLAEAVNDPPDYLASALMEAHCLAGRPELAMELYYPCPRLVASAVRALLQMDRHEEAREMYQRESRPTHELVSVVAKDSFDRNEWRQVVDAYQWGLKSKCLTEDLGFWAIQAIASGHFPGRIRTMRSVVEELAQLSGLEPLVWASNNYWTLKNVVGFPNACALMFWKYDQDWRELDLAVNTFHQKRKSDQVTKTKVLQTIVQKACLYEGQENKRYARVPQTMEEWHHLLELVQEEAQHAHLMNRPFFVAQLAEAWNNLGRPQAALEVVEHSIGRMSLHVKAIEVGINAADKIGTPAADLRMLGLDDRK